MGESKPKLVVNELLFFIDNMMQKIPHAKICAVVLEKCSESDIYDAKTVLYEQFGETFKRRQGTKETDSHLSDIFEMFKKFDGKRDKVNVTFCAVELSKVPYCSFTADNTNPIVMFDRINALEKSDNLPRRRA